MAWNPSPEVADCRYISQKWGKEIVVIIAINVDGQVQAASFGKTRHLCDSAKIFMDAAVDAIIKETPGSVMKTMFPEMDAEIAMDRLASRREQVQRARDYLRDREGFEAFVIKELTDKGPSTEVSLALWMSELCGFGSTDQLLTVITVTWAMWRTEKLWRKEFKNHPCGERCYIYGIRGVHKTFMPHEHG